MNQQQFEDKMRRGEAWHGLRVPDDVWTVVRVDGRGFSRFTQQHFQKPFDERFHQLMTATAQALLEEWEGLYAYVESDEISLLLPLHWSHFHRSVEKLVSLTAATASAAFSLASNRKAHFDSRLWIGDKENLLDYFRWRQSDAGRCALNGWCYWTLRNEGQSVQAATDVLDKQTTEQKYALLQARGIVFHELPAWQSDGAGLYWQSYQKMGFNPRTGQNVLSTRRRIVVNRELPTGESYARFIADFLD